MSNAGVQSWTYTAADNSTVNGIVISENCPAANINNALRQVMSSVMQEIAYQGTDISASVSMSLAGVDWRFMAVTGSASIVHVGTGRAGLHRELIWRSPSTLVNSANVINDGGANIVTATNDVSLFLSMGSGAWLVKHLPSNGISPAFNQEITASATTTDLVLVKSNVGAPKLVPVSSVLSASASFSASKNGVDQNFSASTQTKVTFTTEVFDVGSYYDAANSRWTPPVGKYLISIGATLPVVSDQKNVQVSLYKNGVALYGAFLTSSTPSNSSVTASGSWIVTANGSDYFEAYIWASTASPSVSGDVTLSWFQGASAG